ncbi:hypothetical protein OAC86_00395 [bacterium]|nr:hypothetical protein [bacterium]MDB9899984.1 hypothetical protein [bacterium]
MKKLQSYKDFLIEKAGQGFNYSQLILEGGAAGHMSHPFDETDLTFGDFKEIIEAGLSGNLNFDEVATEKTDGQNVFATVQDGEVKFARNKGELKNPMDLATFKEKFEGHPSPLVQDTFQFAAEDLASSLNKLSPKDLEVFDNGKNWMNMELIYSKNPNVIYYDRDVIQFHGIKKTDGVGNIIGDDNKPARSIAKAMQDLKVNVGKTFTVIPPQIIKLGKDLDFEKNKAKFTKQVELLKNKYKLTDADAVSRYHEMWWRETIETNFPDLTQDHKEGLLLRWAYADKKTLNLRALDKELGKDKAALIKKFDKEDVKKKQKENIRPFEDLFLELGSVILKNASNFVAANPDAEMQRLHKQIRTAADDVKKGGGEAQIAKVTSELERLDRIGGIESIIPTEGIVFVYKGKTMKLTGTFAAINQLMGIIKYGR